MLRVAALNGVVYEWLVLIVDENFHGAERSSLFAQGSSLSARSESGDEPRADRGHSRHVYRSVRRR